MPAQLKRWLVTFTRANASKLEVGVEAESKLDARTLAIVEVVGKHGFWDMIEGGRGYIVAVRDRKRGAKRVFEEKRRSGPWKCEIKCVGA